MSNFRTELKTPPRNLTAKLIEDVGINRTQAGVACEIISDFTENYYSNLRPPGEIIHTAVKKTEPAGKPIRLCQLAPVKLTYFHSSDAELLEKEGPVALRAARIVRFATQAYNDGCLLSYEDLAYLLCVNISTIKWHAKRLRQAGVWLPTRGYMKDIGPEPSHKKIIADLLGRGYTTLKIKAMTAHSDRSIGRYQHQFALVIYLLEHYPAASVDQLLQLSELSEKAFSIYREVYEELKKRDDCIPHLRRLRRRFEIDPEGLTVKKKAWAKKSDDENKRLDEQKLSTAIRQTIEEDLNTTKRVATAVTDDLMNLIDASFALSEALRPGEAEVYADSRIEGIISGEKLEDRNVIPVRLPLCSEEVKKIWRAEGEASEKRARLAVFWAGVANEQGAVMSIASLAELLHTSPSSLSGSLRKLAVNYELQAKTKGLIEDAGPTLTHKDLIVELDQHGFTDQEISFLSQHAPTSCHRYINTYRRAEIIARLDGKIPSTKKLSALLRLRPHVATQYRELLQKHHSSKGQDAEQAKHPSLPLTG